MSRCSHPRSYHRQGFSQHCLKMVNSRRLLLQAYYGRRLVAQIDIVGFLMSYGSNANLKAIRNSLPSESESVQSSMWLSSALLAAWLGRCVWPRYWVIPTLPPSKNRHLDYVWLLLYKVLILSWWVGALFQKVWIALQHWAFCARQVVAAAISATFAAFINSFCRFFGINIINWFHWKLKLSADLASRHTGPKSLDQSLFLAFQGFLICGSYDTFPKCHGRSPYQMLLPLRLLSRHCNGWDSSCIFVAYLASRHTRPKSLLLGLQLSRYIRYCSDKHLKCHACLTHQ